MRPYQSPHHLSNSANIYGNEDIQTINNIAQALSKCGHTELSWNGHTITIGNSSHISHFQLQSFLKKIPCQMWTPVICGRDSLNNLMIKVEKQPKYQVYYTQTINKIAQALLKCGHAPHNWNGHTITIGNSSHISHFQLQSFLKKIPCHIWTPVICGRDSRNNLMIKLEKPTKSRPIDKIEKKEKTQKIKPETKQVIKKVTQNQIDQSINKMDLISHH